jgi:hypothetical protein
MRGFVFSDAASNNGMHPTANSAALIVNLSVITLRARRVMPGVMSPLRVEVKRSAAAPQLNDPQLVWIMREAG